MKYCTEYRESIEMQLSDLIVYGLLDRFVARKYNELARNKFHKVCVRICYQLNNKSKVSFDLVSVEKV